MKEQFVRDIREGEKVLGFFLVKHKQLEDFRDRTRGQFLTLFLSDKTGQVLARVWEGAPELAETFEEGDVVKVLGEAEEYLGRLQVIVDKLRPAKEDEYELADFLPHTERDIEEMLATVRETIASVENPYLRALLDKFFADDEFVAAFSRAPSARRKTPPRLPGRPAGAHGGGRHSLPDSAHPLSSDQPRPADDRGSAARRWQDQGVHL